MSVTKGRGVNNWQGPKLTVVSKSGSRRICYRPIKN